MHGLAGAYSAQDDWRYALIEHLIHDHGADDALNGPWPSLSVLKREHNASHDRLPNGRGVKYDQPDHGHYGADVWRGPTLRGVA